MKESLGVRIHIIIDGKEYLWEELSEDQQKKIGKELNERALNAAGYSPIKKTEEI